MKTLGQTHRLVKNVALSQLLQLRVLSHQLPFLRVGSLAPLRWCDATRLLLREVARHRGAAACFVRGLR